MYRVELYSELIYAIIPTLFPCFFFVFFFCWCWSASLIDDVMWTDMNFTLGSMKNIRLLCASGIELESQSRFSPMWIVIPRYVLKLSLPCVWPVETYKLSNLGNQVTFLKPPRWDSQNSADDPIFMQNEPIWKVLHARPPACKLLGFPVLSNDNFRTQLIAPSTPHLV